MAFYELAFLIRQDISVQDAQTLGQKLFSIIQNNNGKILRSEYWGLRALSYKIRKNRKAHYYMIQYTGDLAVYNELDRSIKLNDNIIRHIILKIDKYDTDFSIMLQNKDDVVVNGDVFYDNKFIIKFKKTKSQDKLDESDVSDLENEVESNINVSQVEDSEGISGTV